MKKLTLLALLAFWSVNAAWAQCKLTFTLSASARSAVLDNRASKCSNWTLNYKISGTSATFEVETRSLAQESWAQMPGSATYSSASGTAALSGTPAYLSIVRTLPGDGLVWGTLVGTNGAGGGLGGGTQGPQGPQGLTGPQGPAGPAGAGTPVVTPVSVSPSDTSTTINYPVTLSAGVQAQPGCVDNTGKGMLWASFTSTTTQMVVTWQDGGAGFTGSCTAIVGGAQGPAGTAVNTILTGSGAPSNVLGANGDYYVNVSNPAAPLWYGPKAAGTWPSGVSVVGPAGPTGPQGPQGPAGLISWGTFASLPGTCAQGVEYAPTNSIYAFAVCTATNVWTWFYDGKQITIPPAMSLTSSLQAGVTVASTNGYETMAFGASGSATRSYRYWTAPATPYSVTLVLRYPPQPDATTYRLIDVGFMDNSGAQQAWECGGGLATPNCRIYYGTNGGYTANDTTVGWNNNTNVSPAGLLYVQLSDPGGTGNLTWKVSYDGYSWTQIAAVARLTRFSSGPTRLWYGGMSSAATFPQTIVFAGVL